MSKKRITLNESDLKNIIKNSVRKIIKENKDRFFEVTYDNVDEYWEEAAELMPKLMLDELQNYMDSNEKVEFIDYLNRTYHIWEYGY